MVDEIAVRRQIAAGLRRARRRACLSEEDLAEAIAMSRSGLRHLEAARHAIRVEQLPTLAEACGVTVRQLLTDMRLLRRPPKQQTPGPSLPDAAGLPDDGSALGDRSTACDPRGDASPHQSTSAGVLE